MDYSLSLDELRELSGDSEDFDEFVEKVEEALREAASDNQPDMDEHDYDDTDVDTTDWEDFEASPTGVERQLRDLLDRFPDLDPEFSEDDNN